MKKFVMVILIIGMLFMLAACGADKQSVDVNNDNTTLKNINGLLSYDINTKIVYYYFKDGEGYRGYGYMSPYLSADGKFCKYNLNEGKIEEIK